MPSSSFPLHKPCRTTTSSSPGSSSSSSATSSAPAPKQDSGGGSSDQSPRRLTRQRKLRHLNSQDLGSTLPEKSYSSPTSPEYSTQKSRSPGCGSKSNHWSSAPAAPQPLPLPESHVTRKPEFAKDGYFGCRKIKSHTTSGSAAPSSYSSQVATTSGGSAAPASAYSNNRRGALSQDANSGGGFFNNFGLNILSRKALVNGVSSHPFSPQRSKTVDSYPILVAPTSPVNCSSNCHRGTPHEYEACNTSRSAPTSPFSSPAVSPRRSNPTADFFTSFGAPHEQNQEAFPPRLSPNRPAHSPSHSPTSRSPRFNQKISNGNAFPLHSLERAESISQVSAHPLPRPPPPQQSVMPYNAEALSTSSMKGQWQKGKLIGRGTFGSVYLATNRETGALCAMKEVDVIPDDPKAAECIRQLEQEIKVLRTLKHPNIVQYYGSEMTDDHFYIYLEYVHPGSINKYVQDHIGVMTESVVRNFTRHILSGLAFLHSMKTVHRDIKGANLLVDASGVVKLADFGMAKLLNGQSYNLSLKGSPYWMAPEVIRAAMQNNADPDLALAVDIWSLGCTVIEMFNGKPPWSDFTGPQAMFKVLNTIPDIPEALSAEGKDFLQWCFRRNPMERLSASDLLEHPFVRNSPVRPFQS
ncbi:mitogen-activated protein kinase kinase kinase 5-like [Pyrus communis]|uniref:mitogen-activated protein kinase kinase kinase 5-like n=1 Tax=Pyrus communis TaxID=23211 RepID=UPI0035C0C1C1